MKFIAFSWPKDRWQAVQTPKAKCCLSSKMWKVTACLICGVYLCFVLQDVFGSERRKAKMLNFSIAYGKTAMGLAQDWKVILCVLFLKLFYSFFTWHDRFWMNTRLYNLHVLGSIPHAIWGQVMCIKGPFLHPASTGTTFFQSEAH